MDLEILSNVPEDDLVARLARRLPSGRRVATGAGDDCAAVRVPKRGDLQLLKTDCLVEGVHFLREHAADKVGWKALCRAISDIAACGGKSDSALITIAAPADLPVAWLERLYQGLRKAARIHAVSIVGGETARSPAGLFISVALTGWVKPGRLVLRSGGRARDVLFVTGRLGGSFESGRHLTFAPRAAEGRWLAKNFRIHAMMDISDGLGTDLPRLAKASRKGFEVDLAAVPRRRGCSLRQALGDGEDYELLFAASPADAPLIENAWRLRFPRVPLTRIGTLLADRARRTPLASGYTHFSGCQPSEKTDS